MKNQVRNLVLEAVARTIKGASFVAVNNYENKQGEVSNYLLIAGFSRENAMKKDFKNFDGRVFKNGKEVNQNIINKKITKGFLSSLVIFISK